MNEFFYQDKKRAVDAKFEAQKIAFAPYAFQASKALRDLGILDIVAKSTETGVSAQMVADELKLSSYAVETLLEFGLSMELVKLKNDSDPMIFVLGKVGYFILTDPMTIANMNFVADVCYQGAFFLQDSFVKGKPEGLKVLGNWKTIYEGLSKLSPPVQKSWFDFDHFYSDIAFPEALPVVFKKPPKHLFDIGGNTAKWALSCFRYNPDVRVTILDLPGQLAMAQKNIEAAGATGRVFTHEVNMLDPAQILPKGADAVWMSQFLDCFSLPEIKNIMKNIGYAVDENCDIYVLEPFWDVQKYPAAAYSLHATSLYFTTMANGNSKMYRSAQMIEAIESMGFALQDAVHDLGSNDYSLLRFKKAR